MAEPMRVRWGWLKFMYLYTLIGAGGCGLAGLAAPGMMTSALGFPDEDPIVLSVFTSVFLAFGVLSILGLKSPLKYAPVLLLQLCYKAIWLIAVALPMLLGGRLPPHGATLAALFASYVAGDLIAIPFSYLFAPAPPLKKGPKGSRTI